MACWRPLVTAIWPAWRASRVDTLEALGAVARTATGSRATRAASRLLLVAEMALACVLLVSAALLVRTFVNLAHADRGLDTAGVLTAWVTLPREAFATRRRGGRPWPRWTRACAACLACAPRRGPPGAPFRWRLLVRHGRRRGRRTRSTCEVDRYHVDAAFFGFYGVPLARGRAFAAGDAPDAAVVGEIAGTPALARCRSRRSDDAHERGDDARHRRRPRDSLPIGGRLPRSSRILPGYQGPGGLVMLSLRCGAACPSLGVLRERLLAASRRARVWKAERLDDVYLVELARPAPSPRWAAGFAAIAAVAAIGGLFCVLTFSVAERRREIGMRAALGATPARLARLVLGDGLIVAAAGLAVGAAGAVALDRAAAALHYGVTLGDPLDLGRRHRVPEPARARGVRAADAGGDARRSRAAPAARVKDGHARGVLASRP